jgi:UMF1 family MFS transporter
VSTVLNPGVRRREVAAWAMYDFANSGYTTVVITAVFNAYFVSVVAGGADWATLAWTLALAVSYLATIVTGPAIGAYADAQASKKRLLAMTTAGCVLFTAALAAVGEGELWLAVALVILSNYCFSVGENLIAAFLPELARGEALGRVSGWGWAVGYLGGLITLGLCLAWVTAAQSAGATAEQYVPATMLITAGMFLLASLPTFLVLRERARPQPHPPGRLSTALSRIGRTWAESWRFTDLRRFLLCLLCYQAGVQTVVTLAAIYAQQEMGFGTGQTITLILLVNITAAAGAFGFGTVQDRLGHRLSLALTLVVWLAAIMCAALATGPTLFWIAANLVGLALGASQSAGRALIGYLSPPDRLAEFFGLWGVAVKLSSVIGPVCYGLMNWLSGGQHRIALLLTGAFFLGGLLLLATIDVRRGRRAALADVRADTLAA